MQNDEIIWQVIDQNFCSYKAKTDTAKFCRNEFNVTGLCNRQSCPLANSQYATVKEINGSCYLYIKTVERSHTPSKLWERIKLSKNITKSMEQIDQELLYWPSFLQDKCKKRLVRIMEYLKKIQKLQQKTDLPELLPRKKKTIVRETSREAKAEKAAKLELAIEKEVLQRLKNGTYGDIYNFNQKVFDNVLKEEEALDDEMEYEEEIEEELQEREYISGEEEEDLEELFSQVQDEDDEEEGLHIPKSKKKKQKNIEIEYETSKQKNKN